MKHLEGKDVILVPTGNRSRYNKEPRKAHIVKVARVNVTFVVDGYPNEYKLRIKEHNGKTYLTDKDFNSGYQIFKNEKEMLDDKRRTVIAFAIGGKYRYATDYLNNDLETLEKVSVLLGVEIKDKESC